MQWGFLRIVIIIIVSILIYVSYTRVFLKIPIMEQDLGWTSDLITAVIVLVAGYLGIRIFSTMIERIFKPTIGLTRTRGVKNFFQIISAVLLLVAIFAIFHYDVTSFFLGAGITGIVLGLAAQQVLGNIFAGFSLLASHPFEIGDRITLATSSYGFIWGSYPHENQISGFTGTVGDIGIFYTKVTLENGTPAAFPNSVMIGSMIVNHSKTLLRTVRVRLDLDKRIEFATFKAKLLDPLLSYKVIDSERSSVEMVDIGATTYQVVIIVWTASDQDEPIKTIVIQEAMKVQKELTSLLPKSV